MSLFLNFLLYNTGNKDPLLTRLGGQDTVPRLDVNNMFASRF